MATEIDRGGSGWTDPETGITYSASGEALNAPDTGGSSHFDPSGQLITAAGEKVDMSAYAPITAPENYPGGFWGYYQHLVDTGQVNNDTQGLGGVGGFIRSHGYLVPLALASGGLALEAAGGLGALGTSAELAGPTYGELGITGVEGGFAGPTYAEMGYTGLNQAGAIAAADAAAAAAASQGLTGADALKYGSTALKGISTANQLAKLLGGTTGSTTGATSGGTSGGTSGINPQQLASLLGGGQQTNSFIGQIKANQNPFTFTSAGQTAATPGMYDVSGSNLANALRKA